MQNMAPKAEKRFQLYQAGKATRIQSFLPLELNRIGNSLHEQSHSKSNGYQDHLLGQHWHWDPEPDLVLELVTGRRFRL